MNFHRKKKGHYSQKISEERGSGFPEGFRQVNCRLQIKYALSPMSMSEVRSQIKIFLLSGPSPELVSPFPALPLPKHLPTLFVT